MSEDRTPLDTPLAHGIRHAPLRAGSTRNEIVADLLDKERVHLIRLIHEADSWLGPLAPGYVRHLHPTPKQAEQLLVWRKRLRERLDIVTAYRTELAGESAPVPQRPFVTGTEPLPQGPQKTQE